MRGRRRTPEERQRIAEEVAIVDEIKAVALSADVRTESEEIEVQRRFARDLRYALGQRLPSALWSWWRARVRVMLRTHAAGRTPEERQALSLRMHAEPPAWAIELLELSNEEAMRVVRS